MKILIAEYWFPLLLWLGIIYFFSTDAFSGGETSRIIVPVLTFFFPGLSAQEIHLWHGMIRKFGHVAEYFVLTVFTYRSVNYRQTDIVRPKLLAGLFVLCAALLDEWHQSFTASRGASLYDVGYDCFGGLWALWFIAAYEAWRIRTHTVL